jgi:hypothetical protein
MSLGASPHSDRNGIWVLWTIAFAGLLQFAATPRARAETQGGMPASHCSIDHELHEAIEHQVFTAARPSTGGTSYRKRVSAAGANIISGGTSTSIVGIPSRTGTIATTTATTINTDLTVAWGGWLRNVGRRLSADLGGAVLAAPSRCAWGWNKIVITRGRPCRPPTCGEGQPAALCGESAASTCRHPSNGGLARRPKSAPPEDSRTWMPLRMHALPAAR